MATNRYNTGKANIGQKVSRNETCDKTELRKLIQKVADGNAEAFGELYSLYLDRIYRYVFYQVGDKLTAEDLTEEIFVKAWGAIRSHRQKIWAFSAWLYRIAHNHVVDYFRSRQRIKVTEKEIPATVGGPEQEVEKRLQQQELLEALSCLPSQQRQLITLKFIEELDNNEIAHIMKKSQGAVRVMQMRALATLRQKLSLGRTDASQVIPGLR